jgi:hypothetical protein
MSGVVSTNLRPMSYLYGDSTPSTLDENFIEFLRDSMDFCVAALLADDRARHSAGRATELRKAADADTERLRHLSAAVTFAIQGASSPENSPAARCGAEILSSAEKLVTAEIERVAASLTQEVSNLDAEAGRERGGCFKALEEFLLRYDLPNTKRSLELRLDGGERYTALMRTRTSFGLAVTLELELPADHLFAKALKVERIADRVEVQVPDSGRWLYKEGKLRAQRLEKLLVTELVVDGFSSSIKLRTSADSAQGFDVKLSSEGVFLVRLAEKEGAAETPFRVGEADAKTLTTLFEKLSAASPQVGSPRKALTEATLDERPLSEQDPAVLVERVVAALAPTAQEIARRSPSPNELVLKRLLSDNRREEIFVTKAELRAKLEPLSPALRTLFLPLGLSNGSASHVPPPVPSTASSAVPPPPSLRSAPPPPVRADGPRRPTPLESKPPVAPRPKSIPPKPSAPPSSPANAPAPAIALADAASGESKPAEPTQQN